MDTLCAATNNRRWARCTSQHSHLGFRLAENVHYAAWEHNAKVAFLHGADILFPLEFCIYFGNNYREMSER